MYNIIPVSVRIFRSLIWLSQISELLLFCHFFTQSPYIRDLVKGMACVIYQSVNCSMRVGLQNMSVSLKEYVKNIKTFWHKAFTHFCPLCLINQKKINANNA